MFKFSLPHLLTISIFILTFHLTHPFYANGFSDQPGEGFFAGLTDEQDTDESFLNRARVDTSYFLAEGPFDVSSLESLVEGEGFLSVTLETKWKKVERGITLVKSQQKYKGLEVFGGEVVTRHDKDSQAQMGFLFKGINVSKNPKMSKNEAISLIKEKFGEADVEGTLGILPTKSDSRLAYRFNVARSFNEIYVVYIDANTGKILRAYNQVDYLNAADMLKSSGQKKLITGSGMALNDKRVNLSVSTVQDGQKRSYVLFDPKRKIITLDALHQFRIDPGDLTPKNKNDDAQLVTAQEKDKWNNKAAVSAHYHSELIYDFMSNKLKRKSIDGKGIPIRSIVNAVMMQDGRRVVDNAFYAGEPHNLMIYLIGSWDGKKGFFKNLAGALDVAAHEMAHGITNHTSGLEYLHESGAINESFSDMFGVAVEYFYDRKNFEWAVGEDIIAPSNTAYRGGLRLLDQPKKRGQPDTYHGEFWYFGAKDQGGVHINSGVGNKAFYLMANGDTHNGISVPGIGVEKAVLIAYRANQIYMTKRSQYLDCARGFILAAKDLYGNKIAQKVYLAWKAVKLEVKGLVEEEGKGPQTREKPPEEKQSEPPYEKPKEKKRIPTPEKPKEEEEQQQEPTPEKPKEEQQQEPTPEKPKEERRIPPAQKPPVSDDGFLGDML